MQHNKRIILGLLCVVFLPMHGSWFNKKEPKQLSQEEIAVNNRKLSAKNLAAYIQDKKWAFMMTELDRTLLDAVRAAACDKKDPNLTPQKLPNDPTYQAYRKMTLLGLAAVMGDCTIGNLLIGCNADVNKVDGNRDTALKIAIGHNRDDFVQTLLNAQADPNQRVGGLTPLMWVVEPLDEQSFAARYLSQKDPKKFMQPLLAAKADPGTKDEDGDTVVVRAARKANFAVLKALSGLGVTLDQVSGDGKTLEQIAQANFDLTQQALKNKYQRDLERSSAHMVLGLLRPPAAVKKVDEGKEK